MNAYYWHFRLRLSIRIWKKSRKNWKRWDFFLFSPSICAILTRSWLKLPSPSVIQNLKKTQQKTEKMGIFSAHHPYALFWPGRVFSGTADAWADRLSHADYIPTVGARNNDSSRQLVTYTWNTTIYRQKTMRNFAKVPLMASWLRQVEVYLKDMGMTGLASAWAMARRSPREYRHKVDAATRCSDVCPHTWPDR